MIKKIEIPFRFNYYNLIYCNYIRKNEYFEYYDASKYCLRYMAFIGDLKDIQEKGLRQ